MALAQMSGIYDGINETPAIPPIGLRNEIPQLMDAVGLLERQVELMTETLGPLLAASPSTASAGPQVTPGAPPSEAVRALRDIRVRIDAVTGELISLRNRAEI